MPYVTRDLEGRVVALHADSNGDSQEQLAADDPDVLSFVGSQVQLAEVRNELEASDLALVRVIEDLIAVLIDNGTIKMTDLPSPAQKKLAERDRLRARLGGLSNIASETDEVMLP